MMKPSSNAAATSAIARHQFPALAVRHAAADRDTKSRGDVGPGIRRQIVRRNTRPRSALKHMLLAGATTLTLAGAPGKTQAADCDSYQGCLVTALNGLVKSFAGEAEDELWGWMLGGSQSAGLDEISSQLDEINTTLTAIEEELGPNGPIVQQLQKLQCADDSSWIEAGPATTISTRYNRYSNFLQDLDSQTLGEISIDNTDITTLYGWANAVIQGTSTQEDVLTSMVELNSLTTGSTSTGTISDCIIANGSPQVELDDRPYYEENVVPIEAYLLYLNTQAMIVLTEAYHIYAYGECVTNNDGDTSKCSSDSADEVIPNVCPSTSSSRFCHEPVTIYGRLGDTESGQFMPFTYAQLKTGGAPISTDYYLTWSVAEVALVRSIETFNEAAGAGCPVPATTPCGPARDQPNDSFQLPEVSVGPYGFGGGDDRGSWVITPPGIFNGLLSIGLNGVGNAAGSWNSDNTGRRSPGNFLCAMGMSGGDLSDCTQAVGTSTEPGPGNGGMGLQYAQNKIIYHPGVFNPYGAGEFASFTDMNFSNQLSDMPMTGNRWGAILTPGPQESVVFLDKASGVPNTTNSTFPNWYAASWSFGQWDVEPGYLLRPLSKISYYWPMIKFSDIACSDSGDPLSESLNPAGAYTLCGDDFDAWYANQIPSGPTQLSTTADTTLFQSSPSLNDDDTRLYLNGRRQTAAVAFDPAALAAFLEESEFVSARLVLSVADDAADLQGAGGKGEDKSKGNQAARLRVTPIEYDDYWPYEASRYHGQGKRVTLPRGFIGKISIEVTDDVKNGASAWRFRELNSIDGVALLSSEGAEELGRPGLAPTLILHTAAGDDVALR